MRCLFPLPASKEKKRGGVLAKEEGEIYSLAPCVISGAGQVALSLQFLKEPSPISSGGRGESSVVSGPGRTQPCPRGMSCCFKLSWSWP